MDQRAAHLYAWLWHHARARERGHARRVAGAVHQGSAVEIVGRSHRDSAGDLLRSIVQRSCVREDRHGGVRLSARRRQCVRHIRRHRRPRGGQLVPAAAVRGALQLDGHLVLAEPHGAEPGADVPAHLRAREAHRAISHLRQRTLSIHLSGQIDLGTGCVYDQLTLSLLQAFPERHQLHPQLGEGHGGCLRWHGEIPSAGYRRPGGGHAGAYLPDVVPADVGNARGHAHPAALSAGHLCAASLDVLDVSHDQPGDVLQRRGSVGHSDSGRGCAGAADVAVLHRDEAAGRDGCRVHPDAAVHAAPEGQPRRLDGGAQRRS